MNPEIKELWVNALLSGEYVQGEMALRRVHADGKVSWCCLGVLCDLAVKAGVTLDVTEQARPGDDSRQKLTYYGDDEDYAYLPRVVQEWAGLDSSNPFVRPEGTLVKETLASLNDSSHRFPEIAALIGDQL